MGGAEAQDAEMHPVTLRFTDKKLEYELRGSQFESARPIILTSYVFFLLTHCFMCRQGPKYHIIAVSYVPVIIFLFCYRIWLSRLADQGHAHALYSRAFTIGLFAANIFQRLTIRLGWHPVVGIAEAVLYMSNYTFTVIFMHVQFMDFWVRLACLTSIFLSLSTAGWAVKGDASWSTHGQPYDTLIVAAALVLGSAMGYAIELALRGAFLARAQLHSSRARAPPALGGDDTEARHELSQEIAPHAFEELGLIGRGGSADVFLVRRASTEAGGVTTDAGVLYAMKRVVKRRLSPLHTARVREERAVLKALGPHPFVVTLHVAFESQNCFYFALTYAAFGDLTRWMDALPPDASRLVAAEVLCALKHLHGKRILYRDVKPENTLVGADGHILLADFGVSKRLVRTTEWDDVDMRQLTSASDGSGCGRATDSAIAGAVEGGCGGGGGSTGSRSTSSDGSGEAEGEGRGGAVIGGGRTRLHTLVGTPDYMSPELFGRQPYSYEVDFWALAVLLHEILTGQTVGSVSGSRGDNPVIAHNEIADDDADDLLSRMLTPSRESRLGFGPDGHAHIREHAYFKSVDWGRLVLKELPAPIDAASRLTVEGMGRASEPDLGGDADAHYKST